MKFQTPFEPMGHKGLFFEKPSLTKQEFRDECDITNIIDKFSRTGELPQPFVGGSGVFADVSDIPDYQSSQNNVVRVREWFDGLPSNIRSRFDNDPSKLVQFINDPSNRSEAEKLGLLVSEDKTINPLSKDSGKIESVKGSDESGLENARRSTVEVSQVVSPEGGKS